MQENKNVELENARKIAMLERKAERSTFCYYLSEKQSQMQDTEHTIKFEFEVHAQTYLKIDLFAQISSSACNMQVVLNGSPAFSEQIVNGSFSGTAVLPFISGVNSVEVKFSAGQPFTVKNCKFETFGNLSYLEKDCILQVLNEENYSVVLFLANDKLILQKYVGGEFTTWYSKDQVKSASICKWGSSYLLATINADGVGYLNSFTNELRPDYDKVLDNQLSSLSSFGGSTPSVFAIKGNNVYRYDIEEMMFFKKRKTGYTGKKIKCNPTVKGYLIIIDHGGNAKLIQV